VELLDGRDDRLQRRLPHSAEPPQRVLDLRRLRSDLRVVGEILEATAAAGRVVLAGRVHALRPRREHLDRQRLRVVALHLRHPRANPVARQTAANEDDEPVQPRDAVPAVSQRVDREL
jgi:hypothetical protein